MKQPSSKPLVTVACITYNQAKYIRQTFDSFLMQKTDFVFEILINDDASDDGTTEIIKEYQKKHPDIITAVFHEKNLYSQGVRGMYARFLFPKARGKYIALCEGDDYWTDPKKLQIQTDFMEKHPECSLSFHPVNVFFEEGNSPSYIYPEKGNPKSFDTKHLLQENFIQTNSVMYLRQKNYGPMATNVMPGDWYMHLYHAQFGKIGFIDRVMSVYRRHPGGLWWDAHADIDKIWEKHGLAHLALYDAMMKLYGDKPEYRKIIDGHIAKMLNRLIKVDKKNSRQLLVEATKQFPQSIAVFMASQHEQIRDLRAGQDKKEQEINGLQQTIQQKDQLIAHRDRELSVIKSSKAWKARNKIAKITGKEEIK